MVVPTSVVAPVAPRVASVLGRRTLVAAAASTVTVATTRRPMVVMRAWMSTATPGLPKEPKRPDAVTPAAPVPSPENAGTRRVSVVPRSFTMLPPSGSGGGDDDDDEKGRHYAWIEPEAERLVARAYAIHMQNQDHKPFPPSLGISTQELETLAAKVPHYVPKTTGDRVALRTTQVLEKLMFLFFREKYVHHALTLETVASVPGFVAAMHRHLRSLRRMQRDYGWTEPLLEESINERAHLLIWLEVAKPTAIERAFVLAAQVAYTSFYATMYALSPRTAHRAVGYLEEAALRAYTEFLELSLIHI